LTNNVTTLLVQLNSQGGYKNNTLDDQYAFLFHQTSSFVSTRRDQLNMATQTHDIERELSRDEKSGTMHAEHMGGLSENDADFVNNFPEDRKKAVVRKVDVS
jgi:hypothetical protein